eukprot:jgi/Tetstr1/436858/TSEL_002733.t1
MPIRCECGVRQPSFGLPEEDRSPARWCSVCPAKPPTAVNVTGKRCECGARQPSFGLPGEGRSSARWCSACPGKPGNAVDVYSK